MIREARPGEAAALAAALARRDHLELDSGEARADAHPFYEREQPTWKSICFGWAL